jgi:hypothetical protein
MRRLSGHLRTNLGGQCLVTRYSNQLKRQTQDDGESLLEFATAIEHITPCSFPALCKDHVYKGAGKAFIDSIRGWGVKQQLLQGGEETLSEALRQTLDTEVGKLAVRSFIRLRKMRDRALWRSKPTPKWKKRLLTAYVSVLWQHRPLSKFTFPQSGRRSVRANRMLRCHSWDWSQTSQSHSLREEEIVICL